jgi:hypothetical protein
MDGVAQAAAEAARPAVTFGRAGSVFGRRAFA